MANFIRFTPLPYPTCISSDYRKRTTNQRDSRKNRIITNTDITIDRYGLASNTSEILPPPKKKSPPKRTCYSQSRTTTALSIYCLLDIWYPSSWPVHRSYTHYCRNTLSESPIPAPAPASGSELPSTGAESASAAAGLPLVLSPYYSYVSDLGNAVPLPPGFYRIYTAHSRASPRDSPGE